MANTPSYYLQRAAEFEALAAQASEVSTRENYLELAQGFRRLANKGRVSETDSDAEAIRLAERMIGLETE